MSLDQLLHLVPYACLGVFVLAVAARSWRIARLPLHLRWELYPVAHEKRASYGGSYYEDVDWWKKPRERSLLAEVKAMFMEIVFLVALKEHNPKMWKRSFPFHFGLYLIAAATIVMIGYSILVAISADLLQGGFASFVMSVIRILAYSGLVVGSSVRRDCFSAGWVTGR